MDRAHNDDGSERRVNIGNEEQSYWAYLPDLVLEIIFQMLPYKVKFGNGEKMFLIQSADLKISHSPGVLCFSKFPNESIYTLSHLSNEF